MSRGIAIVFGFLLFHISFSCGATGAFGPTGDDCRQYYKNASYASLLESVVGGVQKFRIPLSGRYKLRVYGAKGGNAHHGSASYQGGNGALVWGTFDLSEGDIINVVVGHPGDQQTVGSRPSSTGGAGIINR